MRRSEPGCPAIDDAVIRNDREHADAGITMQALVADPFPGFLAEA
jgi:hypothetical protein